MVNQGPDRRRQATPGRKDDVKDTLLAAPIREHMDELANAERLPADMAPRDLETLVCARGAKLSLKSLSKRLESPRRGSRGLIYDLPATARPARIHGAAGFGGRSGANVISQAEKFAKLGFSCG